MCSQGYYVYIYMLHPKNYWLSPFTLCGALALSLVNRTLEWVVWGYPRVTIKTKISILEREAILVGTSFSGKQKHCTHDSKLF